MLYRVGDVARIMNGKLYLLKGDEIIKGISTDSRKIKRGDIFFGIKGERFDGASFAKEAYEKGACCVVVPEYKKTEGVPSIFVDEPVMAMGRWARSHLINRLKAKVIGITGSAGKTTTKDLIAELLSVRYTVSKSPKSFNGFIGLPYSILTANEDSDYLVLEYGINHPYEMDYLISIAKPDIAVLTTVGKSHLEFLGTEEQVAIEKAKLFKSLGMFSIAVLNKETEFLDFFQSALPKMVRVYYYQTPEILEMSIEGTRFKVENEVFYTPLIGLHIIRNLMAAITVAKATGIRLKDLKEKIMHLKPSPMRMEVIKKGGLIIINDAYNANPISMKGLIDTIKVIGCKPCYFVFGDMLELGKGSPVYHQQIGEYLSQHIPDAILYTVGEYGKDYIKGAWKLKERRYFKDKAELLNELRKIKEGCIIFKASRKIELEKVIEELLR